MAVVLTAAALLTWAATGRDVFTTFGVVMEIDEPLDPLDPLAGLGFHSAAGLRRVERREEFRLRLLLAPSGPFDPHAPSVVFVVVPDWAIAAGAWWRHRRAHRQALPGVWAK